MLFFILLIPFALSIVCYPEPGTPTLKPLGKGRGINPGRVAWNWEKDACSWDGIQDFWWNPEFLNQTAVYKMLDETITSLTGDSTSKEAWDNLFRYFNKVHFGKDEGYKDGELVVIKVNLNVAIESYEPTFGCNTISPQFLKALIRQLVDIAGVPQENISNRAYDAARWFQVQYWDEPVGIGEEFPNVNIVDCEGGMDYVKQAQPDVNTNLFFSNHSVIAWNTTRFPTVLTEAKYVIEIDPFRGHTLAGFTATGKNWFGSVWHPDITCDFSPSHKYPGHWCPAFLHKWVNITGLEVDMGGGWLDRRPMGVYNPIVDLLGHDDTASKGLIFFSDALYGGETQMYHSFPVPFAMSPFHNSYSCSIFASQDPIALDSVIFDFLRSEPNQVYPTRGCTDNYLHEGSQANNPPSGVTYAPSGKKLDSLGVHEHWNNADDKQYTRNLGTGDGIELIQVFEN